MSKLVSVVITTRNRRDLVLKCLESVFESSYKDLEVVLADNASTDDTVAAVSSKFPKVKIAQAERNLGLNGGKNLGQAEATGNYVFFLDSDTRVDKECIKSLVDVAEQNPKVGIVCPKMYYDDPPNTIWYAGSFVNFWTSQTKNLGVNEVDNGQWDNLRETDFAPTAYLAKRGVVNKLKGHWEELFMTYGDTDYGYRAKSSGYKVMFAPKAKLWHHLGAKENTRSIRALGYNLPMRPYYFARNRVMFMKRHATHSQFLLFLFMPFPLITLMITTRIAYFGGWRFMRPHLEGSLDGLIYSFTGRSSNKKYPG